MEENKQEKGSVIIEPWTRQHGQYEGDEKMFNGKANQGDSAECLQAQEQQGQQRVSGGVWL